MNDDSSAAPSPGSISRPTKSAAVPDPAVRRLSLYLRELENAFANGLTTISSKQLGQVLSLTDAQVRKDLAYFGQFGHPGIGYKVEELIAQIRKILGTDRSWNALVLGAGNLGRALLSYRGFGKKGFQIVAVFDNAPDKIGQRFGASPGLEVLPLDRLNDVVGEREIQVALLCVPAEVAQEMTERLVAAGIKGILNFAPTALPGPADVSIVTVDLAVHLEQLAFRICANQVAGG